MATDTPIQVIHNENDRLRAALNYLANFACKNDHNEGEPCECCLHVSDAARFAMNRSPTEDEAAEFARRTGLYSWDWTATVGAFGRNVETE